MHMKTLLFKLRHLKINNKTALRRIVSFLLCICISATLLCNFSGMFSPVIAATATDYVQNRVADPSTMDDYMQQLLSMENGSRYAGRIWTDKSVFAYKAGGTNKIGLDMEHDGYKGEVGFNADFAHVFSALASSQVVNEYPPSPIDMVLVLDISSSMGDETDPDPSSPFGQVRAELVKYFEEHPKDLQNEAFQKYYTDAHYTRYDIADSNGKDYLMITFYSDELEQRFLAGETIVFAEHIGEVKVEKDGNYKDTDVPDRFTRGQNGTTAKQRTDRTGKLWGLSAAEAAAKRSLTYTRYTNLIYSADRVITALMNNNPENRVAVIVYDRRASVVMPLAHYTPNTVAISDMDGYSNDYWDYHYLPGGKEDPYQEGDDEYKDIGSRATTDIIGEGLQDMVFGYLCPYIDGHGPKPGEGRPLNYMTVSDRIRVVAQSTDPGITTRNVADSHDENQVVRISGTNTHAGLTAGLEQLANATDTTFSAKLSTGEISTVPRIPAAIVMTDGGSNTVAGGPWYDPDWADPVQRNDNKSSWSSVVDTQYLMTAAYLKSAVEKNYSDYMALNNGEQDLPVYTVGVDLRDDSDAWVPARLYPMLDPANYFTTADKLPNFADSPNADTGEIPLDNETKAQIAEAYKDWLTWAADENAQPSEAFEVVHWSSSNNTPAKYFQQEDKDNCQYPIPFEHDKNINSSNHNPELPVGYDKTFLYQSDGTTDFNLAWHGWASATEKGIGSAEIWRNTYGVTSDPTAIWGLATYWAFSKVAEAAEAAGEKYSAAKYTQERSVEYTDNATGDSKTRSVYAVTQADMISNINYVTEFHNVTSSQMENIFEQILTEIEGQVFVPLSGDNDAGVADSITYQDPLGDYMEIKNQAIDANTHLGEGTYDMSLLLFGKMHGLVRAGTYDWQWNDDYMEAHPDVGTQGEKPFPMGWYWGDDPKTAHTAEELGVDVKNAADGTGTYPAENPETHEPYDNAEQAWADGWVYRFNLSTMLQFVPLNADIESSVHPADAPEQIKNTVYTCYRFAGSKTARNQLYRNPVYGDVPAELKKIWDEHVKTGDYPVGMDEYSEYPGVYRLSDIRVWAEHTGDFIDQTGSLTPEEQSGYDDSLYVNIPTAAVPTQLAEITLGPNGPISYKDNLDQKTQSTPFRLFYAVGLTEDLILRDAKNNQTGVDVSKISGEYIATHSDPKTNNIYFISNWYSNTVYRGYASDESSYGYSTRGDAAVSFSPSVENRYYLFQKPLPLIAHAYRVLNEGGDVAPVDNADNKKWGANGSGNSTTNWEKGETGATWSGGDFIGTYDNQTSFKNALEGKKKIIEDSDIWYITDAKGYSYPLPANINDAIITYTKDQLSKVDSDADGYTDDSNSFSSDDYFFLCIEYYLPMGGTGTDIDGKEVPGTQAVRKINRMIARKGSAFGSGLASNNINNGDMLCWTDIKGNCNLEIEYNSRTDTGDNTRGRPTLEKLTYSENALRTYLSNNGLYDTGTVTWTEGETEKTGTPLDRDVAYWMKLREDPHMAALIEQITAPGVNSQEKFDELFDWSVAARTGGIRVGDMYNNVQPKGGSTDIEVGSDQYYAGNKTHTANNYYVPTLSETSTAGNGMVINNYLGNNGRMEIANTNLIVTKMLVAPDGFTLTEDQENEDFDYQVYVQGVTGERLAQRLKWNPFSQSWQKRVESLDILTDNSSLLLDTNGKRALFCYQSGEPRQVVEVVEDGETKYYYADESGAATKDECTEGLENLYYMYLPSNASGDSDLTYHLFGSSYEGYPEYDGTTEKIDGAGTTAYYPDGTDTAGMADNDMQHFAPATADRDPGSREYWTTKAELIPYKHVYDAEHPADSIDSGSAEIAVIALEAESGVTRWDHETDHDKGEHVQLNDPAHPFTLVTVIPDKNGVESTVYSPFSSRTQYMTVPLYFGYDGEIAGHLASEGETLATCEHRLTGYALTQDELYDPNIPTTERSDLFGSGRYNTTPEQIAQNTTEFTLKSSEGLLLTGLGKDITYRFTEKLTNTQIEQGCTLKEINHVQGSDISEVDQHDSNGVYSVFGDTDYLTEQTNYINTIDPELFVLTKSMVDINGNKIDVAPDEEFTFTLTFEPADSAAMTDIDDTLHYWKGNKDYQSAVEWTDGDHTYKMPTTAPKLDEYEPYLDGSTYRLKPIEPDGGKGHTYTVHLKANEAIVFYGLIAGTKFTVKETPNKKYPVVPGVGPEDRGYTQTGTIYRASVDSTEIDPETTHNRAEFTNRLETGALTVEKWIKDAEPNTEKEFGFTVTLTPAPGTELKPEDLEATKYKADGMAYDASEFTISWNKEGDSQKAEVMLKHGEKVVINGIPLETTYTVDETNRNGYTLKDIEANSGNVNVHGKIASGKIEQAETAMTFVNVPAVFLPEAGGMGILIFCIIGALLIACAIAYIVLNRKKLFNKYRR